MVSELSFQAPPSKFVYAQEHEDQYAAYWPANHPDKKAKGVVAFIHGGCWLTAYDMSHSYAFATGLAQAGFHVWSIEYRRTGNGGEWPIALEDTALGLKHISILNSLGVDLSKINIVGHSAGGHLAAMLSVQLDDVLLPIIKQVNVIGLAAIMNTVEYAQGDNSCETATPSFMRGTPAQQPIAYYLANPQNFAVKSERLGNFQLLQGDADEVVSVLQARHPNAKTEKFKGAGHYDWIHPGSDAFKQLLLKLSSN
jgi:acetyl esterase/lipase